MSQKKEKSEKSQVPIECPATTAMTTLTHSSDNGDRPNNVSADTDVVGDYGGDDDLSTPVPSPNQHKKSLNNLWPRRYDSDGTLLVPIQSVNPHIVCGLCQGYLFEACTITECMHSFCRNCLVRHIQRSLNCPMCAILIHPTDPFVHIRLDGLLQNIVYALLPKVEQIELERERLFYEEHEDDRVDAKKLGSDNTTRKSYSDPIEPQIRPYAPNSFDYISPVSLCLQCLDPENTTKHKLDKEFVRVTGGATIRSLSSFLKRKLKVEDASRVDFYCPCRSGFVTLSNGHTIKAVKDLYCYDQDVVQLRYDVSEQ